MRGSLIRHVDPWQDAARGAHYEAHVAADRLPRLGALARLGEPLEVVMSFAFAPERNAKNKGGALAGLRGGVQVELSVKGAIEVDCQRCLEPMTVELAVHNTILIVRDETAARASEASAEAIVSEPGEHLDLAALVEDETLLGMPFAPCHPEGECELESHVAEAMAHATVHDDAANDERSEVQDGHPGGGRTREAQVSGLAGAAREHTEGTVVEARSNPFAVLARLRDGGEEKA